MDKLIVGVAGLFLNIIIYWFFFKKNDEVGTSDKGEIILIVEGGYRPSVIKLKKNKKTVIKILRKDPNPCLEEILIPDFKISKYLPVGKNVEVVVEPKNIGESEFHCNMNMHKGKIIVVK